MASTVMDYYFAISILQIIWIDVLLSGDNAVVIAMACRSLPPRQRTIGITLGIILALVLRIVMAGFVLRLLSVPFLKGIGGLLLIYIAVKVIAAGSEDDKKHRAASGLLMAVILIAFADVTMSLDNVVAVAAAARGSDIAFAIGLAVSLPLMIIGASLITALVTRFPIIVWFGGGLLGWIAGAMIVSDPFVSGVIGESAKDHYIAAFAGMTLVVVISSIALQYRRYFGAPSTS